MDSFDISYFDVNTTEKYKSLMVYLVPLSAETLTKIYKNGWKLFSFNVLVDAEHNGKNNYSYMFENVNYNEKA